MSENERPDDECFAPDTCAPATVPAKRKYVKNDKAALKLAEVLFYEGRSIKEISRISGITETNINFYAYKQKEPWTLYRKEVVDLKRSSVIVNLCEAATNYSNVLRKASQDLVDKVVNEGEELTLSEQKAVSDIISSQIKAAQISQDSPQNQTNIQINMTKDEVTEILDNDPAKK